MDKKQHQYTCIVAITALLGLQNIHAAGYNPPVEGTPGEINIESMELGEANFFANLTAQDQGPLALGQRFLLSDAGTTGNTEEDAAYDASTNQVLIPLISELPDKTHNVTLLGTGENIWTVLALSTQSNINTEDETKVVFMQGPEGEDGVMNADGIYTKKNLSGDVLTLACDQTNGTQDIVISGGAWCLPDEVLNASHPFDKDNVEDPYRWFAACFDPDSESQKRPAGIYAMCLVTP